MKKNGIWGNPTMNIQKFTAQEYVAACGAYINGLICEVYGKYGKVSRNGNYATWETDGYEWHAKPGGACTTWIDAYGNAEEEGGGTYQNDLTWVSGGPAEGQSQADFLKSLSNGDHPEIIVQWSTNREGDNYIHKGYISVKGNHS